MPQTETDHCDTEIVWEESDLLGNTACGLSFDLRPTLFRAIFISRIRDIVKTRNETLTSIRKGANLQKTRGWWRNVETGVTKLYGSQIDSICRYLGITPFQLISGKARSKHIPKP